MPPLVCPSHHHQLREFEGLRGPGSFAAVVYIRTWQLPSATPVLRANWCCCAAYATIATVHLLFFIVDQRAAFFFESPLPALVHAVTHCASLKAHEVLLLSKRWSI